MSECVVERLSRKEVKVKNKEGVVEAPALAGQERWGSGAPGNLGCRGGILNLGRSQVHQSQPLHLPNGPKSRARLSHPWSCRFCSSHAA